MKKIILLLFLLVTLSAWADERGEARLERISRHYLALGRYALSFVLRAGEEEQSGILAVDGNNSYVKVADTEIFVIDSLRYEVRSSTKEIVVDRADAYEKELLNPLNGFSGVSKEYQIEEFVEGGRVGVRLVPKRTGENVYIETAADGESISKVRYGNGANGAEVEVLSMRRNGEALPKFDKERYKGFEMIDFR